MAERDVRAGAARWLRDLYPGYFALCMASGIVSTGLRPLAATLSWAVFAFGLTGFGVLTAVYLLRLGRYPGNVRDDASSPARGFGFFTVAAGSNVLAARAAEAGWRPVALGLAATGTLAWVVLSYTLPAVMITRVRKSATLADVNGTWLIWVVATQSVAATSSILAETGQAPSGLASVAVAFWSAGAVLYVVLITLVLARLVLADLAPDQLTPPYWITMGATAITVLAGGRLLAGPATPATVAVVPVVRGISFMLWTFGTWWVPLLLVLGVWRYTRPGARLRYDPGFWSVVFPLGMYGAATRQLGTVTSIGFMRPLGETAVWVAFSAWVLVAGGMLRDLGRFAVRARSLTRRTGLWPTKNAGPR